MQIRDHIVYHNLPTRLGHSGSAIMARTTCEDRAVLIGVHTHKGTSRNSGVYLNKSILGKLIDY
jgi:V8-like Glu-specific endopeptidase